MTFDGQAANRRRMVMSVFGWLLASMGLYVVIAATATFTHHAGGGDPAGRRILFFWAIILMSALLGPSVSILQIPDLKRWDAWEGLVLDEPAVWVT